MWKFNILFIFIYFTIVVNGKTINKQICADLDCKGPISFAKTLLKYASNDRKIMSFGLNEDVLVYKKYEGENANLWTVQIGGRRGEVPKQFIREYKIVAKSTVTLPIEEVKETEPASLSSPSISSPTLSQESLSTATKTEIGDASMREEDQAAQNKETIEKLISAADPVKVSVNEDERMQGTESENLAQPSDGMIPSAISNDPVVLELKPSPVMDHITSVEFPSSVSLDNIVEYTDKNEHFSADPVHHGAWFPDVTSSSSSLDDTQKLSLSSEAEHLLPSIASAENLDDQANDIKYIVVDGTSIYDEIVESIAVRSDAEDSVIQPTPVVVAPSPSQASSFPSINYYESSGTTESIPESTDLTPTSGTFSETTIKESADGDNVEEPKDNVDAESEVVSNGWLNGISSFFSLDDDDLPTNAQNGERLTTPTTTIESLSNSKESTKDVDEVAHSAEVLPKKDERMAEEISDNHGAFYAPPNYRTIMDDSFSEEDGGIESEKSDVKPVETKDDNSENSITSENALDALNTLPENSSIDHQKVVTENNLQPNAPNKKDERIVDNESRESTDETKVHALDQDKNEEKLVNDASVLDKNKEKLDDISDSELLDNVSKTEYENSSNSLEEQAPVLEKIEEKSSQLLHDEIHSEENTNKDPVTVIEHNNNQINSDDITEKSLSENLNDIEQQAVKEYITDDNADSVTEDHIRQSIVTDNGEIVDVYEETPSNKIVENNVDDQSNSGNPDIVSEAVKVSAVSDTDFCYRNNEGNCDELSKKEGDEIDEQPVEYVESSDFISQIRSFLDVLMFWLPDPLVGVSHKLEAGSISPYVVVLTIIVGTFVFLLEISFIAIRKSLKERQYLTKLSSLDQKLFSTIVERDGLKQELTTLKMTTENDSSEYLDAQKIIDNLGHELRCSKTECEKLQAENATLQEQLETATDVGFELNQMLSEFLTSQNHGSKLQDAVTKLQEQLESQQSNMGTLQLKLESAEQENIRYRNETNEFSSKLAMEEQLNAELTDSENQLTTIKEQLEEEIKIKDQQNLELQQSNSQLLKEGEDWNESVQRLHAASLSQQSKIQELNDTLTIKANELAVVKEFLTNLKYSNSVTEDADNNENKEACVINADKILEQISNVSDIKTKLVEITEERNLIKSQLLDESKARSTIQETIETYVTENAKLKDEYNKAHQERIEAQTKLDVLSNYFKEKEMQLQKELGIQEAMRQQSQESVTSVTHRIATYEQESELNRAQITTLKTEIENQDRSFKTQLLVQEKKAHENWLAARVAERKVEQMKQEAAVLRNKLTLMEQDKAEQNEANKSISHQANSSTNGEHRLSQNALEADDRSASMDLPTSGRSSLFREPIESDGRFRLPPDRPLPPPPFMPPLPMLPPPHHMLPMGAPVPLLPHPPHLMGPRRLPFSPVDAWMPDRMRHSSPYDHPSNRDRRTPPTLSHQRSPPPFDDRSGPVRHSHSQSSLNRSEDTYTRDFYREQTPPSRFTEQPLPNNSYMPENVPPHLRRYKLDNGGLDSRKSSVSRTDNSLSSA